ncbi:hypothetical protein MchiMG62_14380 [Methanoculleus chikugoensis]|uniref:YcfA-like protein n=1 Tax=Methanoculleus chikugoensis TaxID=118126 RepID=A0ABM7H623_9EURY|nr:hypothetical protein MchiMG62_14380 [Methanoculleus chikugoensis]
MKRLSTGYRHAGVGPGGGVPLPAKVFWDAHIRSNSDGTTTPLTMPNHPKIKGPTLRTICTQAGISREEFLRVYERV